MDELDKKLLNELQLHGLQDSETLATHFAVGGRTIRRRIGAMKSKGIIKIIAVPNPVLLGYKAWAKVGIKVSPAAARDVAGKLVEHPSIYFVASSFGKFDFIIAVHFDTIEKLTRFVNSELSMIAGIENTETMILISPRRYYDFYWPVQNEKGNPCAVQNSAYAVDDVDLSIINILTQDGLTPPAVPVLKSRLKLAEGTIRKRIKRMLEYEVFRVEVSPNPAILEYEVWATIGIAISQGTADEVIDALLKNPSVYLASTSIGRFNIIIAARFHNIESFTRFINVEMARIPAIDYVEPFLHTKPLKYHNIKWSFPAEAFI